MDDDGSGSKSCSTEDDSSERVMLERWLEEPCAGGPFTGLVFGDEHRQQQNHEGCEEKGELVISEDEDD